MPFDSICFLARALLRYTFEMDWATRARLLELRTEDDLRGHNFRDRGHMVFQDTDKLKLINDEFIFYF